MSHKQFSIPSMEQRKSQINMLNSIQKERRESKEFLFPDEHFLHKRRPSALEDRSASQSEDDENVWFEVNRNFQLKKLLEALQGVEIQFPPSTINQITFINVYLIFCFRLCTVLHGDRVWEEYQPRCPPLDHR